MRNYLFAIVVAFAAFSSCSKDDVTPSTMTKTYDAVVAYLNTHVK